MSLVTFLLVASQPTHRTPSSMRQRFNLEEEANERNSAKWEKAATSFWHIHRTGLIFSVLSVGVFGMARKGGWTGVIGVSFFSFPSLVLRSFFSSALFSCLRFMTISGICHF
jgi:hypothetical protein